MPRKSAVSLSVVPVSPDVTGKRRLSPPAGLLEPARLVFLEVVAANGPEHFTRSDLPLLLAYCTACAMERQASEALGREGAIVGARESVACGPGKTGPRYDGARHAATPGPAIAV